jgi:hypothetical protein
MEQWPFFPSHMSGTEAFKPEDLSDQMVAKFASGPGAWRFWITVNSCFVNCFLYKTFFLLLHLVFVFHAHTRHGWQRAIRSIPTGLINIIPYTEYWFNIKHPLETMIWHWIHFSWVPDLDDGIASLQHLIWPFIWSCCALVSQRFLAGCKANSYYPVQSHVRATALRDSRQFR